MSFFNSIVIFITIIIFTIHNDSILGTRNHRVINFRSPDLFPASFAWDPTSKRFIVASSHRPSLVSISDTGHVDTLVSDRSLPAGAFFVGVTVDPFRQRILAVVNSRWDPSKSALATYHLHPPHRRLFLASLHNPGAMGVAVDFFGNAAVTNSRSNFIWKVSLGSRHMTFSSCPVYNDTPIDHHKPWSSYGLNGIVYNHNGYFLVVQTNTGKLFKVYDENGMAQEIELSKNLTAATAVDVKSNGVVLVVSKYKLYFIDSDDGGWDEAKVIDEVALDTKRSPSSVTVGGEKVYVLYGDVEEGITGNSHRNEFSIVEIGPKPPRDVSWLTYTLVGFGSVYCITRMLKRRRLDTNVNKKRV